MNECFLEQNARVLKVKNTIDNYIYSQDINPLEFEIAKDEVYKELLEAQN